MLTQEELDDIRRVNDSKAEVHSAIGHVRRLLDHSDNLASHYNVLRSTADALAKQYEERKKVLLLQERLIASQKEAIGLFKDCIGVTLQKVWSQQLQIDNGRCAVCKCAFRSYIKSGDKMIPGPCSWPRCLSREVEKALALLKGAKLI